MMFKKTLVEKIYPIPHNIFFDRWIGFVASYFGNIAVVNQPLILYRQHGGNVTDVLREKKKRKTIKMKIEKREVAFSLKVEQLKAFLNFFKRNNIENESTKIIQIIYNELKKYQNYFFNCNLFIIYFKYKEKIFQIKGNKFVAMFKFSCGLKMYKLFPFL